jgi:hypothetical protein
VGRHALALLGTLGLPGARVTPPCARLPIAGVRTWVVLESDRRALVLSAACAAPPVWDAIVRAGGEFGLSCVGAEAIARFALIDQVRVPPAP